LASDKRTPSGLIKALEKETGVEVKARHAE
jgi:hypothetical protein